MLFEYILGQLDGELNRLRRLRAAVVNLGTPTPSIAVAAELAPAIEEAKPSRRHLQRDRSPAEAPQRRVRQPKRMTEPTALGGAIPSGPVVVLAGAMREQVARKPFVVKIETASSEQTPDALVNELSARWRRVEG